MLHWLRTLLTRVFVGPTTHWWVDGKRGLCAYCRQERQLFEVPGTIGTGNVFVFRECENACIAIAR